MDDGEKKDREKMVEEGLLYTFKQNKEKKGLQGITVAARMNKGGGKLGNRDPRWGITLHCLLISFKWF